MELLGGTVYPKCGMMEIEIGSSAVAEQWTFSFAASSSQASVLWVLVQRSGRESGGGCWGHGVNCFWRTRLMSRCSFARFLF